MPRAVELSLSRLESREVPAASLFADIRPGVWGSNPTMHGVSGDTLYFSANNIYQGKELWASDGTAAGTRLVADLNPGKPGSGIYGIPAGDGVFYFIQQNEGSGVQSDYKTDGTTAGTVPVAHGIMGLGGQHPVGWKGELYAYTRTPTGGWALSKSDGTTVTQLTTFNDQELETWVTDTQNLYMPPGPSLYNGGTDRLEFTVKLKSGGVQVWQTDGTVAGTTIQQANLTATSPTTGEVKLHPGIPIGGGRYVFRSVAEGQISSSLWVGDATPSRTLLRSFDGVTASAVWWEEQKATLANGRAVFQVLPAVWNQPPTADTGVWVTDGTAAGTSKLNLPALGDRYPVLRGTFDGKAVVQAPTADLQKYDYYLTDGTTLTPMPAPAGTSALKWELRGTLPADATNPKGSLLFQENVAGKVYRTDGTAAGTGLVDMAGLPVVPPNTNPHISWSDFNDSANLPYTEDRGFYFKNAVYYPGRNPNVTIYSQEWTYGSELWKWDLTAGTPTTPPAGVAPTVTGTIVNDSTAQRSMVRGLTVSFDSAVTLDAAGVTVSNAAGESVPFDPQLSTVNGKTTLTITFPVLLGGSLGDGRWTLKINAGAVKSQTGETPMVANYSFEFLRLFGDLTGDGVYDREARTLVAQSMGKHTGEPGFNSALDWNSNGVIDSLDETAVVRNWGKSLPPVSPPTGTPPKVTGTVVNDGSAQRSMVKSLTVAFDSAVTVDPAGVLIFNAAGHSVAFSQQLSTVNGKTVLTITFPNQLGGSIADGRWTLKINAGAVKSQTGGTAMAANSTHVFTRVYGDLSGDGKYDRSTRTTVSQLLGRETGDPGFDAAYDVNSDGKIDSVDELAAIRNWDKMV